MRETADKRLNIVSNFLVAGTAGAVSRAVVHPYSVTKIISEVGAPGGKTGFVGGYWWLIKSQGWSALAKGATPAVVRAFPHIGIQFTVYDRIVSMPNFVKRRSDGQPSIMASGAIYLAGGTAGVAATLVTHPLDVVKVRMIAMPNARLPYKGMVDALTKIMQTEGVSRGLYRGLFPSLVGSFIFSGEMFALWDFGDNLPWRRIGGEPFVPFEWFLVPCMAIGGAAVVTHPLDVIRRKFMAQSPFLYKNGYVDVKFNSVLGCVFNMWKYYGLPSFLFGITANVAKVAPQLAVFWFLYKWMNYGLGGKKPGPFTSEKPRMRKLFD